MHELLLVESQVTIILAQRKATAFFSDGESIERKLSCQNLFSISAEVYLPGFSQLRGGLTKQCCPTILCCLRVFRLLLQAEDTQRVVYRASCNLGAIWAEFHVDGSDCKGILDRESRSVERGAVTPD